MQLHWSDEALEDVDRLYDFLALKSPAAAEKTARLLLAAPTVLLGNPLMGSRVEGLDDEDVRRLIPGAYEIRYKVAGQRIEILRIFHAREDR